MEIFGSIIGNENIKNTLGAAIKDSKFLHAYIIEGPKGTGKRTVARIASAAIMCRSKENLPCGICESCRKILNGNCADVNFYDAFKIDDIRKIKETLYETSTEYEYKIYILNDAHKMTVKAQNALLVSLEDPPENVVFFLLCTDAGALLETIRSRAQLLRTEPLDEKVIFDYIKNNAPANDITDEKLMEITVSSSGSLGYALDMSVSERASEIIAARKKALDFVKALLSCDAEAYSYISSLFAMGCASAKEMLLSALTVLRDIIVLKKNKTAPLCFFALREDAIVFCDTYNLKKLMSVYESVQGAINDLNSNASVPNTFVSIMTNSKKKGN